METIFGYTWEQIQAAQQGKPLIATPTVPHYRDIEADLVLLMRYGAEGLREVQYYGVIDRLTRAGLMED